MNPPAPPPPPGPPGPVPEPGAVPDTGDASAVLRRSGEVLRPALTLYLDLHRHPELSGHESRTARLFAERLAGSGCEVTGDVGGHGVVGVLRNGEGPRVYLRAELDALPLRERTGLPYASGNDAMHACGHDLHLAAASGAVDLLARGTDHWRGTVVVVGQPAEETLTGARAMLRDGLYARFGRPDVVLAQHAAPLPSGMVAHGGGHGPVAAASATLAVVLHGRGGHAATPHLTVDPVVTAAAVITRLQTVVSRETAPAEQVALTVGSVRAGTAANVVPERAELGVGVRAATDEALERAVAAVERIVRAECAASACPREPEVALVSRSPALWGDPWATEAVRRAHTARYGPARVGHWPPSMAAEDFPLFGDRGLSLHGEEGVPLVYWMVGVVGPGEWAGDSSPPPNHSPHFAPHVRTALPSAISALATAALDRLGGPATRPGP
ncbi:amidohydrolase [Streptomyces sp. TRM 70351]|uniref:amidohydrolase n=1 Tax=Streptomyces sp. TRM 70351 TaxID=3116552 RepID=UPI002E7B6687|nr:amidohydrolase [Streptomyces sp. TRM 70351]MEE1926725.1 amidohydrolase [Streptomyces sp. TRM 70351]